MPPPHPTRSNSALPDRAELETTRVRQDLITLKALDLYHENARTEFKNYPIEESFSTWMYYNLSPNFFSLSANEKCIRLCKMKPENADAVDKKTLYQLFILVGNDNPELILRLKASPAWKAITPVRLELFHKKLTDLLGNEVDRTFSNSLFPHLSSSYFRKDLTEKIAELKNASSELVSFFLHNKVLADEFLRKSLENDPELTKELEQSVVKDCLIPIELNSFHKEMENLTQLSLPWAFSNALCPYITSYFWDQTLEYRFEELKELSKNQGFLDILKSEIVIANAFLRKSLQDEKSLIESLHKHPILKDYLLPERRQRKRKPGFFPDAQPQCKTEAAANETYSITPRMSPSTSNPV